MELKHIDDCPLGHRYFDINLESFFLSFRMVDYYQFDYSKISNQVHFHDCYELVYIVDGRGVFLQKGKEYRLEEGSLFLSDPGDTHEIHIDQGQTLTILYLMFTIRQKNRNTLLMASEDDVIFRFLKGHRNVLMEKQVFSSYISYFEQYTDSQEDRRNYWFVKTGENFVFHCLDSLCMEKNDREARGGTEQSLLENALQFINRNLAYKITADDIAKAINTSRRNLYKLFRRYLDRTVHDFIKEKKIGLAENYLQMDFSVSETAALVGMENLSQFSKTFKSYAGSSPMVYKKKFRNPPGGYGRRYRKPNQEI